jgi:hypothetical protein
MKAHYWIFAGAVTLILGGCNNRCTVANHGTNSTEQLKKNVLKVKVTAEQDAAVGYGNTYKCTVKEVLDGKLSQDVFFLVVMAGDDREAYIVSHLAPAVMEITFKKGKENVPYNTMPITGFVDETMTSWEVVSIE